MPKKPDPSTLSFTTPSGQTMTLEQLLAEARSLRTAAKASTRVAGVPVLSPVEDEQTVFDALLLIGGLRGAAGLDLWLKSGDVTRHGSDKPFNEPLIKLILQALEKRGLVELPMDGRGYSVVDLDAHAERLQALLLMRPDAARYWRRFIWVMGGGYGPIERQVGWLSFRGDADKETLLRLFIFSGATSLASYEEQMTGGLSELAASPLALRAALTAPWMPKAVAALDGTLRSSLLARVLDLLHTSDERAAQVREWLGTRFKAEPQALDPGLRARLAEARVQALDFAGMRTLLAGLAGPSLPMFEAAELAARGHWSQAAALFEHSAKDLRKASGARRGALPTDLTRIYVMCLLAQDDPKAWDLAHKFCIGESGSRKPSPFEWWGRWAHVIGTRLGLEALDDEVLAYQPALEVREHSLGHASDRLLLAAWLDKPAAGWTAAAVQTLVNRLQQSQQLWLAAWVAAAAERLELDGVRLDLGAAAAPPANFFGAPREAWRDALAAITSLGDDTKKPAKASTGIELAWQLTLDSQGRVQDVEPLERSVTAKGVVKLKTVSLLKVKKAGAATDARDNAVLRHIDRSPWGGVNSLSIDVTQAAIALIGHPAVQFEDAPGQWVELVEAQPELEVQRRKTPAGGEQFEFRITPPLVGQEPPRLMGYLGTNYDTEVARRDGIRVLRDGPQSARLIRISPAQRRVAELVAQGWAVPASATAELSAALNVLSGAFPAAQRRRCRPARQGRAAFAGAVAALGRWPAAAIGRPALRCLRPRRHARHGPRAADVSARGREPGDRARSGGRGPGPAGSAGRPAVSGCRTRPRIALAAGRRRAGIARGRGAARPARHRRARLAQGQTAACHAGGQRIAQRAGQQRP